ncbi:MAG: AAA family ATPase [Aeromonadales bacterium]|nr:AAA family ATPase [Aeromonadales bacterium]MDY2890928.1 AAA family ATPase [Succinivibrio sp.]
MKLMLDEGGVVALKNIILGNPSFSCVRQNGFAFVDKTKFIDALEKLPTAVPVFLRPRRFGKSFLADMLYSYYDRSLEGEFERTFKGTWIYSHKTPKASSYYCLRLDFSSVSARPDKVEISMMEELAGSIGRFSTTYPELGISNVEADLKAFESPSDMLKKFLNGFSDKAAKGERLFIIIDEYDHFANDILESSKKAFKEITSTSFDHEGFIKQFYACLKQYYGGSRYAPIERFFITGVSSVSLNSVTSGFNIATNISSDARFNAMAGFTSEELSKQIDETIDGGVIAKTGKDNLLDAMRKYYDGYAFSMHAPEHVFNSSMCLAFVASVAQSGSIPDIMPSGAGDDIAMIGRMLSPADQNSQDRISDSIFSRNDISSAEPRELNLNSTGLLDFDQAVWMLYFMGYLTMDSSSGATQYRCPNEITYRSFINYIVGRKKICNGALGNGAPHS